MDYASSMKKFLKTIYTNSEGGNGELLICTFNNESQTIDYKYDNGNYQTEKREYKSGQEEMSYAVVNYDIVSAKYGTPVEFLLQLLEITGSSDFVNAFIQEVTKDTYFLKLGLFNMTIRTTGAEQVSYKQSMEIKGKINTNDNLETLNNLEITENNEYAVFKSDEGNVSETITSKVTQNRYDIGIKEVNCWWANIKIENTESTNIEYTNINQENQIEFREDAQFQGVEESTIFENIQGEAFIKEPEEYTKDENPELFEENNLTYEISGEGKKVFLNDIYNYIVDEESIEEKYSRIEENSQTIKPYIDEEQAILKEEIENRKISKNKYNYDSILLTFKNPLKKIVEIKEDKEIHYGVPTGDYSIDGVLALLKNNDGKPIEYADLYDSKTRPGEMLVNGAEMLFQLLDSSENTEGLSDVMRYILYKYSGKDYGVTKFNFGLIGDITFNGTSPVILGDTIQDKVWFGLKSLGYSDISIAAAMGNIHYESGTFDPNMVESGYNEDNGGIGICQWTNNQRGTEGRNTQLKTFASKRETVWQDPDIQVEFLMAELTGSGADGCADYQLMNTTYTGITYNYSEWENAQDSEPLDQAKLKRLTEVFMFTFERPDKTAGFNSLDKRYNYALYYYNMYHGKTLSGGTEGEADATNGIIARFTSNITGRTFTVWRQDDVGLEMKCNRSIAATIASGYRKEGDAEITTVARVKAGGGDILSNPTSTKNYFDQYGLQAQIDTYTYSTVNIKNLVTNGKYVCIWLDTRGTGKEAIGKSGSKYCSRNGIHWIAIIGYDYNNGNEKIYIAEPYGYNTGTGWHDLDELDSINQYIGHFTVVSEK